jgi:hypothetical protein
MQQSPIRLIHASVNHPQTNGKLERAFRDDMRDFYCQYDSWQFDRLRRDLPGCVHYRNHVRGHRGLGGKPAVNRLGECTHTALATVLERLETYACYEIGRKIIPATGRIRMFGRNAHIGKIWANVEVTFFESLEGLEARLNGQCVAVLKDYRSFSRCRRTAGHASCHGLCISNPAVRELLAHPEIDPAHRLRCEDISFTKEGLVVAIPRSKTDPKAGQSVGIPYGSHPETCPVRAVQNWLGRANITYGYLFTRLDVEAVK